jgi:hypothetical protein
MTPAQQRALFIGAALHRSNEEIARRAGMARTATNRGAPLAAWLLRTAELAELRDELRIQLIEALAEVGRGPRHESPYMADSWTGHQRGRHRAS